MHQFSRAILERKQQDPKVKRRLHFYARGEQIPLVAQGVWEVDEGRVQLSTLSPEGEEIWLGWAESSAFFGNWFSVLSTYQAIPLTDVRLKWYSLGEINNSPYIAQTILPQLVPRMRQTEILLAISGQRRIEVRLPKKLGNRAPRDETLESGAFKVGRSRATR